MGIEAPPPIESADTCTLKECYICELGKPIATDLLLNTTSWTSILKLVLAVLHSSDLGRQKDYFSNNEITQFVYCHWERISGCKKWSKEWKSRISDCLSHNKKSFESHERGKWRMKDMSQVGILIDKLKRLHFQSEVSPISPSMSPESPPLIQRSRRQSFDAPISPRSPTIKDERLSDSDTPSSPHEPTPSSPSFYPSQSYHSPSSSQSYHSPSPQSYYAPSSQSYHPQTPYHSAPAYPTALHERRNSYANSFSISHIHLNESADSPPSSPVYLSPRTPNSHHQYYPTPSYSSNNVPPPHHPAKYICLPPPPAERTMPQDCDSNYNNNTQYATPNSYSPSYSRWPAYTHSVDRDMVDLFNRKSYPVS